VTDLFDGHNRPAVNTLCIGVAGGTGSGKTTVANEIVRRVGRERIVTINQDRYYHDLAHLDEAQRIHHNFDHPDAIEESLLVETLELLKAGKPAELPVYDFSSHVRTAQIERAEARPVILLEGILILAIPGWPPCDRCTSSSWSSRSAGPTSSSPKADSTPSPSTS